MIKFFAKRRNRKGFTLTELIVVIGLMAVIIACVVAFGTPVRYVVKNAAARNDALTINKIIGDYIERQLSFADKMDIYVGYKYENTTGCDLEKAFKDYCKKKDGDEAAMNTPHVMLFHYDASVHSFRIYDMIITDKDMAMPADITAVAGTEVFDDAFYANYEYLITTDMTSTNNTNYASKAYVEFVVSAYNSGNEDPSITDDAERYNVTAKNVIGHYGWAATHTGDDPMDTGEIAMNKLSTERPSFAMENIKAHTRLVHIYDEHTGEDKGTEMKSEAVSLPLTRNSFIPAPGVAITDDSLTDTVIFYNIKTFK